MLFRYSRRWLVIVSTLAAMLWLVSALPNPVRYGINDFVLGLGVVSLLASLALDYTCMAASLGSVKGELSAGRWDLLRLTTLTAAQIVASKHGVAQLRVWRMMILIIGLRAGIWLILGVNFVFVFFRPRGLGLTLEESLLTLAATVMLAAVLLIYIVEPFWRARAVTALGVAISARTRHGSSAVLAAGGSVAALWLGQGFIAIAMMIGFTLLLLPLASLEVAAYQVSLIAPIMLVLVLFLIVYGFYSLVQTWSLRRAERWIARIE